MKITFSSKNGRKPVGHNKNRSSYNSNCEVLTASEMESAMRLLLGAGHFDLVFCDLSLRGSSGIDIYERVKRDRPGVEKRFVFITGGPTEKAVAFLQKTNAPTINKPIDPAQLRRYVDKLVNGQRGS